PIVPMVTVMSVVVVRSAICVKTPKGIPTVAIPRIVTGVTPAPATPPIVVVVRASSSHINRGRDVINEGRFDDRMDVGRSRGLSRWRWSLIGDRRWDFG